ncbi:unnamed protein product [Adineta steineri]|uniref:Uncharacterized protein n=1 Tax=Adineta steineri TaxID=433720 RepID=A0A814DAV3_9BILA|nr:unnamed protein product [Adineta steineri]
MVKNESCPIHRVNLSLPIIKNDSYEIYCTEPLKQSLLSSYQKPLHDNNKKLNNKTTKVRSPGHLNHLTGPMLVSLCVEMPVISKDSASSTTGSVSNALISSGYSEQTSHVVPTTIKRNKNKKNDCRQSLTVSSNQLLCKSDELFDESLITKTKDRMWPNIHHPQLTNVKVLHSRKTFKHIFNSSDIYLRAPNTSSLENLSHESVISSNERLHKRIEQLTKHFFPTIRKLRQGQPCPELINNRMHLHREDKRDILPKISRSRVVR